MRRHAEEGGLDGDGVVAAAREPDGARESVCQRAQRSRGGLGRGEPSRDVEHAQRRQAAAVAAAREHGRRSAPPRQDRRYGVEARGSAPPRA
jgi:hypothetical protein